MTDLRTSIMNRIAAEQAKAKTHASVVTYSDGSVMRVDHNNVVSAQNFADRYARYIGNEYTSRATGKQITLVSAEVVGIA